MAEIKRPNYFASQLLVEQDFQDEQAYHRELRHQHNRLLHSWGVVTGLAVSRMGDQQVSIAAGMAIDHQGQEIVLPADPPPPPLTLTGTSTILAVTIAYQEVTDVSDRYQAGGINNYSRITERPLLASTASPPTDGSVIVLAQVSLDANGIIITVDNTVRPLVSSLIAAGATFPGPLTVTGQYWDLSATEGDLRIGNNTHRLKIGVAPDGGGAGDVRIRAQGGTHRLMLGSDTRDVLTIQNNNVSVSGNLTVTGNFEIQGDVIARDTEHIAGNVSLGDADTDQVSINGIVRSTHSSGALQISDDLNVTGQLTTGGSIGIGTTTPNRPLTIQGTGATYLNVRATNGAQEILVGADGGGGLVSTMTNHNLQLRAGGNITRMLINTAGNVGIGVATPGDRLDINGDLRLRGGDIKDAGGTSRIAIPDNSTLDLRDAGGTSRLSIIDNGRLDLKEDNGSVALSIATNGNVGIGTTSPSAKLTVTGGTTNLQQENWRIPTLLNSWQNYGGSFNRIGYFKDSQGIVHLKGLVRNGTSNLIFNLPSGYRPSGTEIYVVIAGNAIGRVDINSSGAVSRVVGSATYISLDSITFRAA